MQTTFVVLVAVVLVSASFAFWWFGRKPYRHKGQTLENLPRFIGSFLHQMTEGSLLFLEPDATTFFLQFKLLRVSEASSKIEFAFPNAPWSREYFDVLKNLLIDQGHNPEVVETGDNVAKAVTAFLLVHFSGSREHLESKALAIASTAFSALGLEARHPFTARYEGQLDFKRATRRYIPSGTSNAV